MKRNPDVAWSSIWAQAFRFGVPTPTPTPTDASTFYAMSSTVVRISPSGAIASLDSVRVYLKEKNMWLTVTAPKGTNPRLPNNIAIGDIKGELSSVASTYEGKKIYMYDGTESLSDDKAISGGYEYLDDYVVSPGCKLFASLEAENVAGTLEQEQTVEWDGLTYVQIVDENRWTQVTLPDNLPDGTALTANMLKCTVLAKLTRTPTPQTLANMRVFRNDSGVAAGLPYKGTDKVRPTSWYSVVLDASLPLLVMQSGDDIPSPDNSKDIQGWHDVASTLEA